MDDSIYGALDNYNATHSYQVAEVPSSGASPYDGSGWSTARQQQQLDALTAGNTTTNYPNADMPGATTQGGWAFSLLGEALGRGFGGLFAGPLGGYAAGTAGGIFGQWLGESLDPPVAQGSTMSPTYPDSGTWAEPGDTGLNR